MLSKRYRAAPPWYRGNKAARSKPSAIWGSWASTPKMTQGAAWLGWQLGWSPLAAYLAGLAAVVGHMFPFYFSFRGGKGVATICFPPSFPTGGKELCKLPLPPKDISRRERPSWGAFKGRRGGSGK